MLIKDIKKKWLKIEISSLSILSESYKIAIITVMKMDLANAISHFHYHHFHQIGLILCYFVFSWQFLSQNGYMPSHLLFLLIFVKKARHQIFHDPLSSQEYVKLS